MDINVIKNAYGVEMIHHHILYKLLSGINELNDEIFSEVTKTEETSQSQWKFMFVVNNQSYDWEVTIDTSGVNLYVTRIINPKESEPVLVIHWNNFNTLIRKHLEIFKNVDKVFDKLMQKYCSDLDRLTLELMGRQMTLQKTVDKKSGTSFINGIIHDIDMSISYEQAGVFVSDKISLDEFLKLGIDDINYSETIYRMTDVHMIPVIEKHLKETLMLGKKHRFDNVMKNRLFYIENCDIQDISEYGNDTLMTFVNDKYKIVDIVLIKWPEDFTKFVMEEIHEEEKDKKVQEDVESE